MIYVSKITCESIPSSVQMIYESKSKIPVKVYQPVSDHMIPTSLCK